MKDLSELTVLFHDYGTFLSLADKLAETYGRVLYHSPFSEEYQDVKKCVIGTGLPKVERCDEWMDLIPEIDLFIFTDIGHGDIQRHLRSLGKPVWGSMGAADLELYRTRFLEMLEEVGLPVAPSIEVTGLTDLDKHLRSVKDKWVKVNRFRANTETWHHIDYDHSIPQLNYMRDEFGGVMDKIVFIVQDPIPNAQEFGYDGFCIDGQYPKKSFQGYEKKNELYLGSWLDAKQMPEIVTRVNEAMSPVFKKYGYRNFYASEIRDEYFIDITPRHAGQTQEHLQDTCTNLPEIMWFGANGELKEPQFKAKFAAEATLHYTGCEEDWKIIKVPLEAQPYFRLTNYAQDGDAFHFPPGKNNEVGVVIGSGDSIEDAIDDLKANLELCEAEPLRAELGGFVDLIQDITKAQEEGVHFSSKPIPKPAAVIA